VTQQPCSERFHRSFELSRGSNRGSNARTNTSQPIGEAHYTASTTPEAFAPFDSADHLDDLGAAAVYLEAALEEAGDDLAFVAQALGTIARSGNVSELALRTGMSREGLHKALVADGNPSFATIVKVARALGLRMHFTPAA
jgi:probable addiction module antidote protein